MKKYYLEDREFNQFTVFDSETGKLSVLEEIRILFKGC